MRAGLLDRRITIQGKSITQSDSGEEVVSWVDVAEVWAEKVEIRGLERFSIKQIVGHSVKTFRIRWSADVVPITVEHRILFDGRLFDITDIREIDRRVGIEIDCYAPSEEQLTLGQSQSLVPSLYVDDDTFFTQSISADAVTLAPSLFVDDDTFFSPTVAVGLLLDNITATVTAAYSFRRLRRAYAGPACRIRRDSDQDELDIGFSGDDFDTATAAGHIGGGSGFIVAMYDQTVNGEDISQVTSTRQPAYSAAGMNGLPTADFDGADDCLFRAAFPIGGTELSGHVVLTRNSNISDNPRVLTYRSPNLGVEDYNNANSVIVMISLGLNVIKGMYNNVELSVTGLIAQDTPVIVASVFDGANHTAYLNNTGGAPAAAVTSFGATGHLLLGSTGIGDASESWDGFISEVIVVAGTMSSGDRTEIYDDQDAYWL